MAALDSVLTSGGPKATRRVARQRGTTGKVTGSHTARCVLERRSGNSDSAWRSQSDFYMSQVRPGTSCNHNQSAKATTPPVITSQSENILETTFTRGFLWAAPESATRRGAAQRESATDSRTDAQMSNSTHLLALILTLERFVQSMQYNILTKGYGSDDSNGDICSQYGAVRHPAPAAMVAASVSTHPNASQGMPSQRFKDARSARMQSVASLLRD
eukprot:6200511-Pleurochrysis_carterae.AAC.1